jgi:hypothetical protein
MIEKRVAPVNTERDSNQTTHTFPQPWLTIYRIFLFFVVVSSNPLYIVACVSQRMHRGISHPTAIGTFMRQGYHQARTLSLSLLSTIVLQKSLRRRRTTTTTITTTNTSTGRMNRMEQVSHSSLWVRVVVVLTRRRWMNDSMRARKRGIPKKAVRIETKVQTALYFTPKGKGEEALSTLALVLFYLASRPRQVNSFNFFFRL